MKKWDLLKGIIVLIIILLLVFGFYLMSPKNIDNKIYCSDSQRNIEACIQIYDPVCGYLNVECLTEPCDLQPQTFGNSCVACSNERVEYYIEGEC